MNVFPRVAAQVSAIVSVDVASVRSAARLGKAGTGSVQHSIAGDPWQTPCLF